MGLSTRLTVSLAAAALVAGSAAVHLETASQHAPRPDAAPPHFERFFSQTRFLRGNLHAHSVLSDGDAEPAALALWYQDHGYAFVAITDHNVLGRPDSLVDVVTPAFAVLEGEEVSMWVGGKQVHVNALCLDPGVTSAIAGGTFGSAFAALEYAIGAIHERGGIALVNHPNFDWALTTRDVVRADGAELLEIASGHPYVRAGGDSAHPSAEAMWDAALTAGRDTMGVAVDDTHHLVTDADPEAFPGVAWVEVFATEASRDAVCAALRRGELYASTGPRLRSLHVDGLRYAVEVSAKASVRFVGSSGRELGHQGPGSGKAEYVAHGDEGYVRARIDSPEGTAWTPAVRIVR
jgi:hypothetical protein